MTPDADYESAMLHVDLCAGRGGWQAATEDDPNWRSRLRRLDGLMTENSTPTTQRRIAGRNSVSLLAASAFIVVYLMLTVVLLEVVPAVDVWFTPFRWLGGGLFLSVYAVTWYLDLKVVGEMMGDV